MTGKLIHRSQANFRSAPVEGMRRYRWAGFRLSAIGVLVVVVVSGCAELTHLTRSRDLGKPVTIGDEEKMKSPNRALLIDAKQRMISSGHAGALVVCAEPSPDAISAIAASGGLSFSKPESGEVAANWALAESAGSIGLRTQSIQLMRDAMYRLCESYLVGAIEKDDFESMHRRLQTSMVAVLAIEQLTGAVRGPAVVLAGKASQSANPAVEVIEKLAASKTELSAAEANLVKAKAEEEANEAKKAEATKKYDECIAAKPECDEKAELEAAKNAATKEFDTAVSVRNDAEKTVAAAKEKVKGLEKLNRTIAQGDISASGTGSLVIQAQSNINADTVEKLATAVQGIARDVFRSEYQQEICRSAFKEDIEITRQTRKSAAEPDSPSQTRTATQLDTLRNQFEQRYSGILDDCKRVLFGAPAAKQVD